MTKKEATLKMCDYILTEELESYLSYCDENEVDPNDLKGEMQSNHLYALAAIILGVKNIG